MIEAPLLYDGARRLEPSVEPLWSPANPALQVASALDRVRRAPSILQAMRTLGQVTPVVDGAVADGVDSHALLEPIREAIADERDTVTAIAAIHALARVPGPSAELSLADLIIDGRLGFEEHATWALTGRSASHLLAGPLARAIGRGGLSGMHAQQALATWSRSAPHLVLDVLRSALLEVEAPAARRYLVETIGLVPGRPAAAALERLALDAAEATPVRRAAITSFSDRLADQLPDSFSQLDGALGAALRTTRAHRQLLRRGPLRGRGDGVHVAQVHLGETGGLATLLPQLGDVLAGQQRVAEPLSILREGTARTVPGATHHIDGVALEPGEGSSFGGRWPAVTETSRAIRAAFLARQIPDLVHLRIADPGTYAAAGVARSLGIPLVYTLAPDPHAPIATAEGNGTLDRATFAAADGRDALWFRANLVERLADEARELVLFPRAGLREQLEDLTGIDLADGPPRHTVIAEGIDIGRTEMAAETLTGAGQAPPVLADLENAFSRLPRDRHGLPVVVSAGRLVELKGMARLVEAFALDEALAARANLVIIGGNLSDPSAAEAAELARVQRHFEQHPELEDRVVLLGQRSQDEVALVLAAAHAGWRSVVGRNGSYACASAKEEFGLAIIEALAAGLPVTAPVAGGPATYVEDTLTGTLVDTTAVRALGSGIGASLDLAADPATAARARAVVSDRYTIERMARTLAAVYRVTAGATTLGTPVTVAQEAVA